MKLSDEHYYSAIMIDGSIKEFVVFEYRKSTYYLTGRKPFSLDQTKVKFMNIRPLGSKEFLARDS